MHLALPAHLQPLTNKMRLRVRDNPRSEWREVAVPRSVRALVLLNIQVLLRCSLVGCMMPMPCSSWLPSKFWSELSVVAATRQHAILHNQLPHSPPLCLQSYGGGRDIVGLGDTTLLRGQEFKQAPIFDDGLIEVCSR